MEFLSQMPHFTDGKTEAQEQREIHPPASGRPSFRHPSPASWPYLKQSACQSAFRAWRYWPS